MNIFKKTVLDFIRPSGRTVFNCHNPEGVKLLTRLRLGLSHLCEHKLKHSFQDLFDSICSCGNVIETSAHYLLHWPNFSNERSTFLNIIGSIDRNILTRSEYSHLECHSRFPNSHYEIWCVSLLNRISLNCIINIYLDLGFSFL